MNGLLSRGNARAPVNHAQEHAQNMTAEDREKHLFYALNSGGLYHSFLERLKPRVQRIVRKRFVVRSIHHPK